MAEYANIIIDISLEKLDRPFQYLVPDRLVGKLEPGMVVQVPFGNGNRITRGYVIGLTGEAEYDPGKLKEIRAVDSSGVAVEAQLIALAAWIREQYGGTMSQALKTVLPIRQKAAAKQKRTLRLLMPMEEARAELSESVRRKRRAQVRLMQALIEHEAISYETATKALRVTASVIRALEERGFLKVEIQKVWRNPIHEMEEGSRKEERKTRRKEAPSLNAVQQQIVQEVTAEAEGEAPRPCLIHGVTGSGKTAVYIELIARAVERGQQAIVLIPEIALTYQTVMRFYERFGERVSILNSRMSAGERYDQFMRAKNGELDVMIGPRSALFTPFSNLGYIIIDEEHENSYKSETTPRYHAREAARQRAKICGAALVLGSATPSLESYYLARQGEYRLFEMTERVEKRLLPLSEIIDLREELKQGNRSILSGRLQELMEESLLAGQQIMLFLNRRGVAGFVSCRACGHVFKCPHCDVSLSQHNDGRLVCHYCGYQQPMEKTCPECGSKYVGGFKAGTQKIEQVVKERFPKARVLRMDFDTTRNKDGYEKILSAFGSHEADILIGTQMIVKGHDFPDVTLVGILAADLSLNSSDFHGPERTFQLLTQAAGRAGRGELPGHVVIQTYQPENYSIRLAARQDYQAFYEQEIAYRRMMNYPPARHMLQMLVASKDQLYAEMTAELLENKVQKAVADGKLPGMTVLGPTNAAVAKVKDVYKKVLYFKHEEYSMLVRVKDALELFIQKHKEFQMITVQFDFNPMNGF